MGHVLYLFHSSYCQADARKLTEQMEVLAECARPVRAFLGGTTQEETFIRAADSIGTGQVPFFDRALPKRDNMCIDIEKLRKLTVHANILIGVVY